MHIYILDVNVLSDVNLYKFASLSLSFWRTFLKKFKYSKRHKNSIRMHFDVLPDKRQLDLFYDTPSGLIGGTFFYHNGSFCYAKIEDEAK